MEKIIELRNISTHFITEDYEVMYAPLFQACVLNFSNEILRFHSIDITKHIAQNFLTVVSSYEAITNNDIRLKYSPEIAEEFIKKANEIEVLSEEYNSERFSIGIRQDLFITRSRSDADFKVRISKNTDNSVAIVKDVRAPSNTHKYSFKNIILVINDKLKKNNIHLDYKSGFNQFVLTLFIDFYDVKNESKFAYCHKIGNVEQYTYSQQFIALYLMKLRKILKTLLKV